MYEIDNDQAYNVEVQTGNGYEFLPETFTVEVPAENFDQAARRGVRKAVSNAKAYNERTPGQAKRPTYEGHYRVVGVRRADAPKPKIKAEAEKKATTIVLTLEVNGAQVSVQGGAL